MKNKLRKIINWSLIIISILSILFFGVFGLNYLKNENRFIFSTGTKIKAFYNSTWEMSKKEVERNNNCTLVKDTGLIILSFEFSTRPNSTADKLQNINRITAMKCSDKQNIWGYNSEISYGFFDNKLFGIRITGKSYNSKEFDSILINKFEKIYGPVKRDTSQTYVYFSSIFRKDPVEINYWQYNDNQNESNFIIVISYLPMIGEIEKIVEKEQNSLFK